MVMLLGRGPLLGEEDGVQSIENRRGFLEIGRVLRQRKLRHLELAHLGTSLFQTGDAGVVKGGQLGIVAKT